MNVIVIGGHGKNIPMNNDVPRTRYASMPIVPTTPMNADNSRKAFVALSLPKRKTSHSAPVMQPERWCHLPV